MTARPRYFDALVNPAAVIARTTAATAILAEPKWARTKSASSATAVRPVPRDRPAPQRIAVALASGPMETTPLQRAVGCGVKYLQRQLRAAEERGEVQCLRERRGNKPALWALADTYRPDAVGPAEVRAYLDTAKPQETAR